MRRNWPQYLLILLVVAVVYGQALTFEFVRWDDETLILNNPYVSRFTWLHVSEAWRAPYRLLYIPLTYNLWAFLAWLTSSETKTLIDPRFFHGANVLLHLASSCMVFAILNRCFKQAWPALAGAILWSIHPLQVEPVAWATGLKDVLSGFLAIAAILLHLQASQQGGARAAALRVGAFALLLLATFAKPGVVVIPFIAFAIEWLVLEHPLRRSIISAAPLLLAVVPAVFVTQLAQGGAIGVETPLWARPLVAGHALAAYLLKLIWPRSLCIDYGLRPDRVLEGMWSRFAWILPVGLTAGLLWTKGRTRRVTGASWIIFLAGVGPVLGLAPFVFQYYSTVADRYVYVSMLGAALVATWLLTQVPPRYGIVAALAILLALTVRSTIQAGVWLDSRTLLGHAMEVNPRGFVAPNNYAKMLMDEANAIRRDFAGKDANDPVVKQWLAAAQADDAEAERLVRVALQNMPTYLHGLNNRAVFQMRRGDFEGALKTLQAAVDESDRIGAPQEGLDRLTVAQGAMNLGHYAQAIENLEKYLARKPGEKQAEELLRQARAKLAEAATRPATAPSGEAR